MVGADEYDRSPRPQRRRFSPLARVIGLASFCIFVLFLVGFLWFTKEIERFARTSPEMAADGIVVLTGGEARIQSALERLRQSPGSRLLISGVHPETTRSAIERATHGEHADLFACCIDIDRVALDTVGNAEQARIWADRHGMRSLILVTSDYHLPRSMMEFRRKLGEIEIFPLPVRSDAGNQPAQLAEPGVFRVVIPEFMKYFVAVLRFGVREAANRGLPANDTVQQGGQKS